MSSDRSAASLRGEFRAIFAVYVFSALLPLLAGFACSGDRNRRLDQRARDPQVQGEGPRTSPQPRPLGPAGQS